jgi:hypothetical protein
VGDHAIQHTINPHLVIIGGPLLRDPTRSDRAGHAIQDTISPCVTDRLRDPAHDLPQRGMSSLRDPGHNQPKRDGAGCAI